MAMKKEVKKVEVIKKDQRQKIMVAQGRVLIGAPVPFKVLHTEFVGSTKLAKERVAQLREEYKDIDGLSVSYFSV
jgi:hypothetical protein